MIRDDAMKMVYCVRRLCQCLVFEFSSYDICDCVLVC